MGHVIPPMREVRGTNATLSLFVPSSVITICQSLEQATLVAGHIGRAAAVFRFDEVVVVDEETQRGQDVVSQSAALLARLLQYQETPQYLRKRLIPIHEDFRSVGALPPLDAPHHQRSTEWSRYREGVVLDHYKNGSLIDIGLDKVHSEHAIARRVGTRVTVEVGTTPSTEKGSDGDVFSATVCSSRVPVQEEGLNWGFTVRLAQGLSSVFVECPFEGGYDLVIGTSEHGQHISPESFTLPRFSHLLVGFGGPAGLEDCCAKDPGMQGHAITEFCHHYVNTCPAQGSRTIRTEEALWISLAMLSPAIRQVRS